MVLTSSDSYHTNFRGTKPYTGANHTSLVHFLCMSSMRVLMIPSFYLCEFLFQEHKRLLSCLSYQSLRIKTSLFPLVDSYHHSQKYVINIQDKENVLSILKLCINAIVFLVFFETILPYSVIKLKIPLSRSLLQSINVLP
jgi:hypothetical protein